MVSTTFTLVSGTYTSEQDLHTQLDFFLTQTVGGWVSALVRSDTSTNKDVVYYTDDSSGLYDRLWCRIVSTGDRVYLYGYSEYDVVGDTGRDIIDLDENRITSFNSGKYWFIANTDAFHLIVDSDISGPAHGGIGHFLSYFEPDEDPKPIYVFGQSASDRLFSLDRFAAFKPGSWGTSYDPTVSGTWLPYFAEQPNALGYGSPNPRTGEYKLFAPLFNTDTAPFYSEIRGEVPGLYLCGGAGYSHGAIITVTGTIGTSPGKYFLHRNTSNANQSWAVGPVTVSGEGS